MRTSFTSAFEGADMSIKAMAKIMTVSVHLVTTRSQAAHEVAASRLRWTVTFHFAGLHRVSIDHCRGHRSLVRLKVTVVGQ
jgi:hypothetical protein